jgi:uncharacterized protein (DUF1810 family)
MEQHMTDSYDLQRFVDAQAPIYPRVIEELSQGQKRTHWMWFVFPQIMGLGTSAMATRFAIRSQHEARSYLVHEVLGPRLIECTSLVVAVTGKTANQILGSPDDMKFRSSMTLFGAVSRDLASMHQIFAEAIARFYPEGADDKTLHMLHSLNSASDERPQ